MDMASVEMNSVGVRGLTPTYRLRTTIFISIGLLVTACTIPIIPVHTFIEWNPPREDIMPANSNMCPDLSGIYLEKRVGEKYLFDFYLDLANESLYQPVARRIIHRSDYPFKSGQTWEEYRVNKEKFRLSSRVLIESGSNHINVTNIDAFGNKFITISIDRQYRNSRDYYIGCHNNKLILRKVHFSGGAEMTPHTVEASERRFSKSEDGSLIHESYYREWTRSRLGGWLKGEPREYSGSIVFPPTPATSMIMEETKP
ncbi:hypothetical protein [Sedimenticola hydrogenitrophicus]|uniref:hypothetical protein n=1 Tax=Sedimenticola hydrogenitrophicus TaxID=2967975 RepID=UPI0021A8066F|nr:hypothetical protein [Sedimenticola hydrogenitrophicus]